MGADVVADDILFPGVAIRVDLVTGDLAVGGGTRKACIIACKTSSGTATADTVYEGLRGPEVIATYGGNGSLGHLAAKTLFKEHQSAQVDFVAVAAPSGGGAAAASQTVTFDDTTPVTVAQTVVLNIMGRDITLIWAAGETDVDFATRFVAEVNGQAADLFVTAANGGGTLAVMTLTAKHNGTHGNDVLISYTMTGGTGGSVTLGGSALAAGAGTMDIVAALDAIKSTEYDLILVCCSNADAIAASTTGVVGKVKTHINTYNVGFNTLLQQAVFGVTGSLSSAKVGPATHNFGYFEYVFCRSGRSLPCEWGGAEVGARLREEKLDVGVNRSNRQDMPYRATLYGPANLTTGKLTSDEEEEALQAGLSPIRYTISAVPLISIPRTTYWKDAYSNIDLRLVYVSQPTTIIAVAKDLRRYLPERFPGAKIVDTLALGEDDLPPNVVEIAGIKAVTIARLREWVKAGALDGVKVDATVKDGTLSVERDSTNDSKVNFKLPLKPVPPLTIYDINVMGVN